MYIVPIMTTYTVPIEQSEKTFVFLRIMIYRPYLRKLKELQNQFKNNTEMFFYLIAKFNSRFNQLANEKNSSKKKYQITTNQYCNIGIRVAPAIHQTFKDISDATSFSISALVRFLIEWEEISNQNVTFNQDEGIVFFRQEIVITEISIHHKFDIDSKIVIEEFSFGFS